MTRVAAIDCGTNSIRLLIADVSRSRGELVDIERRMEIVRLGQEVDKTGEIAPEAMERTLAAARRYADLCHQHEVHSIRFVATSATRDARNRKIFVDGVREALGVEPEVIPGAEEAELSFTGATGGLPGGHDAPFLVVDLGGGSTEFVLGEKTVDSAISVNIGCVRLTERHLRSDPPTASEVAAATADIDAALTQVAGKVALEDARTLVGVAGSITTVTAHALGLPAYDPAAIHGATLSLDQVEKACTELIEMPREQRAQLPFMHPGRVDVIGAGALVWRRIVERMGATGRIGQQVTSEHDILDGMAWGLAWSKR
ncbi:Ppx/GppA phosphatase family protein [Kineosporia sp. NBRC 101731]|uniref:Ppx/GppA phosphatase family protein n=1 Tax=Kineosporia sp. NBRC 101731 TaxID=3032199 RepID=UPI0024A1D854|nr:Ppx/GppA phosphatase family protein [Kineosporia sp. NBRC 101731]GLY28672.1 exopolyphosphatase [Kineosporia sp. NBRC 101731]